jgi:hypothetical protein
MVSSFSVKASTFALKISLWLLDLRIMKDNVNRAVIINMPHKK